MTGRERVMTVLAGEIPDRVPHFELDFQLTKEFFCVPKPDLRNYSDNTAGKRQFAKDHLDLWMKITEKFDWSALPPGQDEYLIKAAKDRWGEKAAVYAFDWDGVFWMMDGNDMEGFAVKLYDDLPSVKEEAEKKCEKAIESINHLIDWGADFIVTAYDFGYNKGPYISPEIFAEIDTPYLKRIYDVIHLRGKKGILHSDGDLNLLLEQLVGAGIDGYQSVDPQGGMDIALVRKKYPNMILMGNVQCSALQDTDEERIRKSVRYAMESAKPGGRYIFSTSNCIFAGMPVKSYEIMLDEYRKLALYN